MSNLTKHQVKVAEQLMCDTKQRKNTSIQQTVAQISPVTVVKGTKKKLNGKQV